MNIILKQLYLPLTLCIFSVGLMQASDKPESIDQHDNPFLSPATSLLCLSKFQSIEGRGSMHSIDSAEPREEISDSEPQEKCWHQVVCVEIADDKNEQLVNHLRKTSPRSVIIRTEEPISSFNARAAKNVRAQNPEPTPIKRSVLQRLFCCCRNR